MSSDSRILWAFSCAEAMPPEFNSTFGVVERGENTIYFGIFDSMDAAHRMAGMYFRYMMIDPLIVADVQAYLRALNRWIDD